MMRALRSDRMTYAVQGFIEEKLGSKFVGGTSVEFAKSFEESGKLEMKVLSADLNIIAKITQPRLKYFLSTSRTFNTNIFHSISWCESLKGR